MTHEQFEQATQYWNKIEGDLNEHPDFRHEKVQ